MTTEIYLKAALAVIALALLGLLGEGAVIAARLRPLILNTDLIEQQGHGMHRVQICDERHCADIQPTNIGASGGQIVAHSWAIAVSPPQR